MIDSLNNDNFLSSLFSSRAYDTLSDESPIYAAPAPDNSRPPVYASPAPDNSHPPVYASPAPDNSHPPVYASPAPMIDSDITINHSNIEIMLIQNLQQI